MPSFKAWLLPILVEGTCDQHLTNTQFCFVSKKKAVVMITILEEDALSSELKMPRFHHYRVQEEI